MNMFWEILIGTGVVFAASKAYNLAKKADEKYINDQIAKTKTPRNPERNSYKTSGYSNLGYIGIQKTNSNELNNAVSSFETGFTKPKIAPSITIKMEYSGDNKRSHVIESDKLDYDPFEGTIHDANDLTNIQVKARIVYKDRNGKETMRDIDVKGMGTAENGKAVYAYCHLRKANRTFIIKNIKEFIDLETGEVIEYVLPYLEKKYQSSSQKSLDDFMESFGDILEILFYVGKADTQLRKEERVIICDTVRRIAKDDRISDDLVNDIMNQMYPCSERTFKIKVGKMTDYDITLKQDIFETMMLIVNTQKTIHPAEQTALDYITKKWGMA
jgi:hypothetical protein